MITLTPTLPSPPDAIHPRLRARLERTLAQRVAGYEAARSQAWNAVADVLHRLVGLNRTMGGLEFAALEFECRAVLRTLDGFGAPDLPEPHDIDALVERVRGIAEMVDALGATLSLHGENVCSSC